MFNDFWSPMVSPILILPYEEGSDKIDSKKLCAKHSTYAHRPKRPATAHKPQRGHPLQPTQEAVTQRVEIGATVSFFPIYQG